MRTVFPSSVSVTLAVCDAVGDGDGIGQVIDLFRASGGEFVRGGESHPNPASALMVDRWLYCEVRHPSLNPDQHAVHDVARFGPVERERPRAQFAFFLKDGSGQTPRDAWEPVKVATLSQSTDFEDERDVDPVALGQVRLVENLYPLFRPRFGYIDESAGGAPGCESYLRGEVPRLFWCNIFGPEYVERLGRDFLREAPGWRLIEFPDGGMMHIATASYMAWWHDDFTELRDYFRQRLPDIEIYRGQPLPNGG